MSSLCCRFCMNNSLLNNIFKTSYIYEMITLYIDSQVNENDGLPPYVCMMCEEKIVTFHDFKEKCLEISRQLKFVVQHAKPEINTLSKSEVQDAESSCTSGCEDNVYSDVLFKENKIELLKLSCDSFPCYVKAEQCSDDVQVLPLPSQSNVNQSAKNLKDVKSDLKKVHYEGEKMTQGTLTKHKVTKSNAKQYSCKLCPKVFTRSAHLIVHMRIHSGLKPYICEYCGKASTKRQDLNRHLKIHSEEKKYSCPKCHRMFKRNGDVYSHMRTHSDDKPYKCPQCYKSYKSPNALLKHKGICMKVK